MTAATHPRETQAERLWTAADGTVCILATCDAPPLYLISLIRDAQIVRERRLYGRASAQMLAQGWRETAPAMDAAR
jgi:hypothetical protein